MSKVTIIDNISVGYSIFVIGLFLGGLLSYAAFVPTEEETPSYKNEYKVGECLRVLGDKQVKKLTIVRDDFMEYSYVDRFGETILGVFMRINTGDTRYTNVSLVKTSCE